MNNETILFILTTVMEIATLACAYLGLRLFKKNKWLRLALMGVILLLCIPFVWPRKSA